MAPLPGAPERATELHARYGYELGEPVIFWHSVYFSYGYNGWGSGNSQPTDHPGHLGLGDDIWPVPPPGGVRRELRANRVRKPAEMIAITDTTTEISGAFGVEGCPSDPRFGPGKIHKGGANVLFCDGHVQWFPQKALVGTYNKYVESEHNIRRMWNNDHKVHGGVSYDTIDGG